MSDKERLSGINHLIECPETSLVFNEDGSFGFQLAIENSEHRRTLVKLRDMFLNFDRSVELVSDRYASRLDSGGVSKLKYRFSKEGVIKMPWEVRMEFVDGELEVRYGVELHRPGGMIEFGLRKSWDPVFNTPVDQGIWSRNNRIKVDALPAFLFVEKWKGPQYSLGRVVPFEGKPDIVRLEYRDEKTLFLSSNEKHYLYLVREEYLRGRWSEIWSIEQTREEMKLTGIEINIKSNDKF